MKESTGLIDVALQLKLRQIRIKLDVLKPLLVYVLYIRAQWSLTGGPQSELIKKPKDASSYIYDIVLFVC